MTEFHIWQGYTKLSQDRSVEHLKKENLATTVSTETTATAPGEELDSPWFYTDASNTKSVKQEEDLCLVC
jgi:hypothetical protein